MSVNEILETIRNFDLETAVQGISGESHVLTQPEIIALSVTAALGILLCLFGWKIVRLWAALAGFVLGGTAGLAAGALAGLSGSGVLITGLVCAVILAALGAILYRAGVFLLTFVTVTSFCIYLIDPQDWIFAGVCLAAGLAAAILSVRFVTVLTIIVTSVYGANAAGTAIYHLLPVNGVAIHIALCVVIGIIGIIVQLLLESRKQKRKNLEKADEIRRERSAANDVERARAMMDDLDGMADGAAQDSSIEDEGDV